MTRYLILAVILGGAISTGCTRVACPPVVVPEAVADVTNRAR